MYLTHVVLRPLHKRFHSTLYYISTNLYTQDHANEAFVLVHYLHSSTLITQFKPMDFFGNYWLGKYT